MNKIQASDINIKDGKGNTPLYYAVEGSHYECVELLIRLGGKANMGNEFGNTALHKAFMDGDDKILLPISFKTLYKKPILLILSGLDGSHP